MLFWFGARALVGVWLRKAVGRMNPGTPPRFPRLHKAHTFKGGPPICTHTYSYGRGTGPGSKVSMPGPRTRYVAYQFLSDTFLTPIKKTIGPVLSAALLMVMVDLEYRTGALIMIQIVNGINKRENNRRHYLQQRCSTGNLG